jgi:hypothetical protein
MTAELPLAAAAYVRSINDHDAAAFIALFADSAIVNDVGREFRGLTAIKAWSEKGLVGLTCRLAGERPEA